MTGLKTFPAKEPGFIQKRRAERVAIASSCCGFTGEVTLTDSAVIILYAGMLGAGDMLTLITTTVLPLFNGLLILPMAYLVTRIGRKKLILRSCFLATAAYVFAALAPCFGEWRVAVLGLSVLVFALTLTGFIAGWFPLLDTFLSDRRRAGFFGKMRFCHQLCAVAFLVLVGVFIGQSPPLWKLQTVLFAACACFAGRAFWIWRIPDFPAPHKEAPGWWTGLKRASENSPLVRFSLYQYFLNLGVYGTIPLAMLYLKKVICAPDNVVVFLSGVTLWGMLLGYLATRKILSVIGLKRTFLWLQIFSLPANLGILFLRAPGLFEYACMTFLLMLAGFAIAAFSIVASSEMMVLASPGNKTIAMAFCGAFYYGGAGASRLLGSLLLGSGIFAVEGDPGADFRVVFFLYFALTCFAWMCLRLVPAVAERKAGPSQESLRHESHTDSGCAHANFF